MVNPHTSELGRSCPQYFVVIPQNSGTNCFVNRVIAQDSAAGPAASRIDARFNFLSQEMRTPMNEFQSGKKRIDIPRRKGPVGKEPHELPCRLFSFSGYVRKTPDAVAAKHCIPDETCCRIAKRRIHRYPARFRPAGENPVIFAQKPDKPVRFEIFRF